MTATIQPAPAGVRIDPDGVEWWSLTAVAAALCCSPKTARRSMRRPGFPQPFQLSAGMRVWAAEEVRAWRDAQRQAAPLPTPVNWTPARRGRSRKAA